MYIYYKMLIYIYKINVYMKVKNRKEKKKHKSIQKYQLKFIY